MPLSWQPLMASCWSSRVRVALSESIPATSTDIAGQVRGRLLRGAALGGFGRRRRRPGRELHGGHADRQVRQAGPVHLVAVVGCDQQRQRGAEHCPEDPGRAGIIAVAPEGNPAAPRTRGVFVGNRGAAMLAGRGHGRTLEGEDCRVKGEKRGRAGRASPDGSYLSSPVRALNSSIRASICSTWP